MNSPSSSSRISFSSSLSLYSPSHLLFLSRSCSLSSLIIEAKNVCFIRRISYPAVELQKKIRTHLSALWDDPERFGGMVSPVQRDGWGRRRTRVRRSVVRGFGRGGEGSGRKIWGVGSGVWGFMRCGSAVGFGVGGVWGRGGALSRNLISTFSTSHTPVNILISLSLDNSFSPPDPQDIILFENLILEPSAVHQLAICSL